jgi:hypothetical protein
MYEYVITAGPGVMLEHGIVPSDFLDGYFLESLEEGEMVHVRQVDGNAKPERFH